MIPFLKVIILAVIQGVTEFLPVSSSGHLVLAKKLLSLESPGVVLEVALHAGTLLAVLIYYRKRIIELIVDTVSGKGKARVYVATLIVSAVPAILLYLFGADYIESRFQNPKFTALMLCITGLILLSMLRKTADDKLIGPGKGLLIGMMQALAMMPGISRSGMTITAARHLGVKAEQAAEFSFLMSVPILAGAIAVQLLSISKTEMGDLTVISLAAGALVSAVVGYAAIACLVKILSKGKLWMFGIYCLALGLIGLIIL